MTEKENDVAACVKNYLKAAQAHGVDELSQDLSETQFESMVKDSDVSGAFQTLLGVAKNKSYKNADFWRTMQLAAEDLHLADEAAYCLGNTKSA